MNRREFSWLATGMLLASGLAKAAPVAKGVRFSYMLWAMRKLAPFDRCVEIVAEAGYQGIELTGEYQKWTPEELSKFMARMRSLGMVVDSIAGVRSPFAVPEASEMFLTQFGEMLKYAKGLECPQVLVTSGKRAEGVDVEKQRSTAVENLKRAAEMAAKAGIEMLIEPIDYLENPSTYLASVTDGFALATAVGAPNVKVLYDFYHEQRSFGNLIEKLEKNIGLVGLIHIADVPGRHEPGTGEVDYTNIYRKLGELHYDRWIAMEYYPTSEPVASLKKARLEAVTAIAGS